MRKISSTFILQKVYLILNTFFDKLLFYYASKFKFRKCITRSIL